MTNNEFYVVEDTELDKMLAVVADDAYESVIETYNDAVEECHSLSEEEAERYIEDYSMYLFVYGNGTWIIDAPDYVQDHRNIVAHAMVGPYVNADTLRYELEDSTF